MLGQLIGNLKDISFGKIAGGISRAFVNLQVSLKDILIGKFAWGKQGSAGTS